MTSFLRFFKFSNRLDLRWLVDMLTGKAEPVQSWRPGPPVNERDVDMWGGRGEGGGAEAINNHSESIIKRFGTMNNTSGPSKHASGPSKNASCA